jgi:thioredoxin-related protein
MRRLAFLAALWISVAAAAPGPHVAWRGWNEGLSAAVRSGKPVIVDVYTDWCGWCKRMDRDVYARPEVSDYLNKHFVVVRLNAEGSEKVNYAGQTLTARALAGGFQVTGYPTTIFLRADGAHLVNVPGYIPADRFLKLVRYIGDGHMDRGVSWEEYSRSSDPGAK